MPFTFLAPFSVKITQNVSRPAAVSRCLIGEHGESICHGKRHPCLSLAPEPAVLIAHYLSDYDAPLSEAGDYTTKYHLLRNLFSLYHSECCVLLPRHGPHIFCLSFSPFPFISPLKLILLVEPALCLLKWDNFAYDYKRGLDMGLCVFVRACVCAISAQVKDPQLPPIVKITH